MNRVEDCADMTPAGHKIVISRNEFLMDGVYSRWESVFEKGCGFTHHLYNATDPTWPS